MSAYGRSMSLVDTRRPRKGGSPSPQYCVRGRMCPLDGTGTERVRSILPPTGFRCSHCNRNQATAFDAGVRDADQIRERRRGELQRLSWSITSPEGTRVHDEEVIDKTRGTIVVRPQCTKTVSRLVMQERSSALDERADASTASRADDVTH